MVNGLPWKQAQSAVSKLSKLQKKCQSECYTPKFSLINLACIHLLSD